jgi:hypothetical protein
MLAWTGPPPAPEWAAYHAERDIIGAVVRIVEPGASAAVAGREWLTVDAAPLFGPAEPHLLAEVLDALDEGKQVVVDGQQEWRGSYAPCLVDGVIDLLLDEHRGPVSFQPERGWTDAEIARALAAVAGHDPSRILPMNGEAAMTGLDEGGLSYLPCLETVLERFVGDRRRCRDWVEAGEILLEAAE